MPGIAIGGRELSRAALAAVGVVLLTGCELFGWIDVDDLPYRRIELWTQPAAPTAGVPGFDSHSVYALGGQNVFAVDRRTGAVRWVVPLTMTGVASAAARVGNVVVTASGTLVAFDTTAGAVAWQDAATEVLGGFAFAHDDSVIYAPNQGSRTGTAVALTAGQRTVWRTRIVPPDSVLPAAERVSIFPPDLRSDILAYSYAWFRGENLSVPNGGVAVVDASTGALRWSAMLPRTPTDSNTMPSDPATDGVGVFVSVRDGRVFGFSAATGVLQWTAGPVPRGIVAPDIRPLTVQASIVVVGSGSSALTGYDARTGKRRWAEDSENGGTRKIVPFGETGALTLHWNGGLTLRDARTGRLLWLLQPTRNEQKVNAVRVVGDTVFGASLGGGLRAFRLVQVRR